MVQTIAVLECCNTGEAQGPRPPLLEQFQTAPTRNLLQYQHPARSSEIACGEGIEIHATCNLLT